MFSGGFIGDFSKHFSKSMPSIGFIILNTYIKSSRISVSSEKIYIFFIYIIFGKEAMGKHFALFTAKVTFVRLLRTKMTTNMTAVQILIYQIKYDSNGEIPVDWLRNESDYQSDCQSIYVSVYKNCHVLVTLLPVTESQVRRQTRFRFRK